MKAGLLQEETMSEKHEPTAGPWQQYGSLIYSEHGMICELSDPHAGTTITHTPLGLGSHDWPEATANAALIASAPALLAACELGGPGATTGPELLRFAANVCHATGWGKWGEALHAKADAEDAAARRARGEA
jgi:hypothetical protein